jgi:hypothetical protein
VVDLFESLVAVTAALEGAKIDYCLVGGLAVAVHGAPRATTDIDLLISPETADDAVAVARKNGFTFEALPQRFGDGMRLRRVTRIEDGNSLTLDFMLADADLRPAWESRERFQTDGGRSLWVVGRDALIAMKIQAGRTKDLADVERLQEIDR